MTDSKRKNSGSISSWVKKRTSVTQVHSSPDLTNKNEQPPINEHTNTPFSTTISISNDIGDYVEKGSQTDHVKARFLESTNVPDNNFQYPFSLHNKQSKQEKRYLKRDHFIQFKWLVYSQKKGGVFCNYCVFFCE